MPGLRHGPSLPSDVARWSGARDLNPGPEGPVLCVPRAWGAAPQLIRLAQRSEEVTERPLKGPGRLVGGGWSAICQDEGEVGDCSRHEHLEEGLTVVHFPAFHRCGSV
jgi:hypothetical protein